MDRISNSLQINYTPLTPQISYYPGHAENPFTSQRSEISLYIQSIQEDVLKLEGNPLDCALFLLQECKKPDNQTELILRDLFFLIRNFSTLPSSSPLCSEDSLCTLRVELDKTKTGNILPLFERWFMHQLSVALTSIEYALWVKEYYDPIFLKNSFCHILTLIYSTPPNPQLEKIYNQAIELSLSFISYIDQRTSQNLFPFISNELKTKETETEKISSLISYMEEIPNQTGLEALLFTLPFLSFSSWDIQEDFTSDAALAHRKDSLNTFCNEQMHPIDRLKNLLIFLSYPIEISTGEWLTIESQEYYSNECFFFLIEILDEEIANKLFNAPFYKTTEMENISRKIRKKLHRSSRLCEYLVSAILSFSKNRIGEYKSLLLGDVLLIFDCLKDGTKILHTLQALRKNFLKIPTTPSHFFKEFNSSLSHLSTSLEKINSSHLQSISEQYKNWPTDYFNSALSTPSQSAIRWIGFFNQMILDELSQEDVEKTDVLDYLKALSPEVRLILMKKTMVKCMRNVEKQSPCRLNELSLSPGVFELYTDPRLFWSDVKRNLHSCHLLKKDHNLDVIIATKQELKEHIRAACSTLHPYLQSIKNDLFALKEDPFLYAIYLLKECKKPANATESIVQDISLLITELPTFTYNFAFDCTGKPLLSFYRSALSSLALDLKEKKGAEILPIFEEWTIRQLTNLVHSIQYALWAKEYYPPSSFANSLSYILNLLLLDPLHPLLEELQNKAIDYSLLYLNDSVKIDRTLPPKDQIHFLLSKINPISTEPSSVTFPFLPNIDSSWVIQDDSSSEAALAHRKAALDSFCNHQKHPIDRLKNLIVFLSYPTRISTEDWILIDCQSYLWKGEKRFFIDILDEKIAENLFEATFDGPSTLKLIYRSIRTHLHPNTSLIEYLISGMIQFSTARIGTYRASIDASPKNLRGKYRHLCFKDGTKILRTLLKLKKELCDIPNTPPAIFTLFNSFFSEASDVLEQEILSISKNSVKNFAHWPKKNFNPTPLTPSQRVIRLIGFFNERALFNASMNALKTAIISCPRSVAPEVRRIFLQEDPSVAFMETRDKLREKITAALFPKTLYYKGF
jgi:hypothetical protein